METSLPAPARSGSGSPVCATRPLPSSSPRQPRALTTASFSSLLSTTSNYAYHRTTGSPAPALACYLLLQEVLRCELVAVTPTSPWATCSLRLTLARSSSLPASRLPRSTVALAECATSEVSLASPRPKRPTSRRSRPSDPELYVRASYRIGCVGLVYVRPKSPNRGSRSG